MPTSSTLVAQKHTHCVMHLWQGRDTLPLLPALPAQSTNQKQAPAIKSEREGGREKCQRAVVLLFFTLSDRHLLAGETKNRHDITLSWSTGQRLTRSERQVSDCTNPIKPIPPSHTHVALDRPSADHCSFLKRVHHHFCVQFCLSVLSVNVLSCVHLKHTSHNDIFFFIIFHLVFVW